jgi:hypothetical protein
MEVKVVFLEVASFFFNPFTVMGGTVLPHTRAQCIMAGTVLQGCSVL